MARSRESGEGRHGTGRNRERRLAPRFTVAALVAAIAIAAAGAWILHLRPAATVGGGGPDVAPSGAKDLLSAAGLPPLPHGRLARPPEAVKEAYVFAAQHPEVVRYVPCFCGCERQGHRSNLDCFVASRAANGEIAWSAHGTG